MSYKNDMRKLALNTMDKLNAIDADIAKLESNRYDIAPNAYKEQRAKLDAEREAVTSSAQSEADKLCESYFECVHEYYRPNGAKLNADADILKSGMNLSADELAEMFKRNEGNITMQRLVVEYAKNHNIDMPITTITTEAMRTHIDCGKMLRKYFSSALMDSEFYADIWKNDKHFERISAGVME